MTINTKLGISNTLILLILITTNFCQSFYNLTNLPDSIFNLLPLFILIIIVFISTIIQNIKVFGIVYIIAAIMIAFLSEANSVAACIFFIYAILILKNNILSFLIFLSVIIATITKFIIFSYNNIYVLINICTYYVGAYWVLLLIINNSKGGEYGGGIKQ